MKPISSTKFIEKAIKIHGSMYDYSKVVYTGSYNPVEIICHAHGSFFQKPNYHILRKSGCPDCYRASQRYNEPTFFTKVKERFGERYTYGEYTGYQEDMNVTCTEHNHTFSITPILHLRAGGNGGCELCRLDAIRKPREEWIQAFVEHHGNKYDYTNATVITSSQKLEVICPDHGSFYPTANNHTRGHGCPTCACNNYIGGYSAEFFAMHPERKQDVGTLYLIKVYNEAETFFKVGITNASIHKRFVSRLPYSYDVVLSIDATLYNAHLCETSVLRTFKSHQYVPKQRFPGWTECISGVSEDVLIGCVQSLLKSSTHPS